MQLCKVIGLLLLASAVEASEKKPVGDEFWEAAKAIRAAEVVLQDAMRAAQPAASVETEREVADAAAQLLKTSENVVAELRGINSPPGTKTKKLALERQLTRLGRNLRLHRRQHNRHRLSARQDLSVALKSIRKAIADLKIAAWDAERRGVDSAARAAAVVVADEARRLYHITQNMAHEEHKAVVEHSTLPTVAAAINSNLTAWNKLTQKHCRHHKLDSVGSHYGSLASAKKACEVRENCAGIYQSGCSGFHFYLCQQGAAFEDSGSSCVYHKPSAKVPDVSVETAESSNGARMTKASKPAAPKPEATTLAAKAAAARALAAQAKKESDSLMDEAVAEVATAARNAEEVAKTVYGKENPMIETSVLEVEHASEGLRNAVLAARAGRASGNRVKNASSDANAPTPAVSTTSTTTTTTTTTTLELVGKVDDAFEKLEASFEPVPTAQSEDAAEGAAQQDLQRLVGSAKEAPIARAFKIQEREEEQKREQAKEQDSTETTEQVKMDVELGNDIAEVSSPSSAKHHNLSPEEWKAFNAPDATDANAPGSMDAELDAAFAPIAQEPDLTPREHHNRLRTVAAAAQKAAEDARKEAEESEHEVEAERPRRSFRSVVAEDDASQPLFQPEAEDTAGIDVPVHQLAFEKAVGMTVEADVKDPDQEEEAKHWHNARKHHKHKHKKHHSHW
jgi:hypothetical protein